MCTAESVCLQLFVIALFFIVYKKYNTIVLLPATELKVIENQSIKGDIEVFSGSSPVLTERSAPDTVSYHTSNQAINCWDHSSIQCVLTQLYLMVLIYQLYS